MPNGQSWLSPGFTCCPAEKGGKTLSCCLIPAWWQQGDFAVAFLSPLDFRRISWSHQGGWVGTAQVLQGDWAVDHQRLCDFAQPIRREHHSATLCYMTTHLENSNGSAATEWLVFSAIPLEEGPCSHCLPCDRGFNVFPFLNGVSITIMPYEMHYL